MVKFEQHDSEPRFCVELSGHITLDELDNLLKRFEEALEKVPPGFVLLVDRTRIRSIDPNVVGVFSYYGLKLLRAKPKAVVVIRKQGGVLEHVSNYLKKFDVGNVLYYVETPEQGVEVVRELTTSAATTKK